MSGSYLLCIAVTAAAASMNFIRAYIIDSLVNMDMTTVLQHTLLNASKAVLFGIPGGLFIPPVIRKLKAFGII